MALHQKRVMVTGGSGFLGSHVVELLRRRGYTQIFVPRHGDYDLVTADGVSRAFDDGAPEIVVHLAALVGGIGANRERPATFFHDNLVMGTRVMDMARRRKVGKVVAVGTVCSYPKHTPAPFKEEDFWNGHPEETNAPFGFAKKAMLVQAQACRQQYGLSSIFLIPVNLYGPGDRDDPASSHVIPAIIKKCVDAVEDGRDEIVVWGTGSATREFLYVDDCAEAIVLAMEQYDGADPVNIGSGCETAVKDLVALVAELTGFRGVVRWDTSKPDGQPRRLLDTSRAETLFGFKARTFLRDGLQKTIASCRRPAGVNR